MRKLGTILKELEKESINQIEMEMKHLMHLIDCEIDWKGFLVYKEYEPVCKKLLEKRQLWYFLAAVTAIDSQKVIPTKVSVAIADSTNNEVGCCVLSTLNGKPGKTAVVIIPITAEDKKEILK